MSRHRNLWPALAAVLAALALPALALADDALTRFTVDAGGVSFVSGGGYALGATIGQPDAGTLAGGAYTLRGGFWTGGSAALVGVATTPPAPLPFRFYAPRPNPVRSRSRLAFDLPRASRVELLVFDVTGRAVRRADYGVVPAGHQEREWSPADDGGRPLASGVYFVRLGTEREQGVRKVLVLR